jgi:NAD(P)-dependent dehydrogenase (short-subunit alcohol dehydrogenase family)
MKGGGRSTVERHEELDLTGKVIIITGASRGIGKQSAQAFARRGANLVLTARTVVPDGKLPGTLNETLARIENMGASAIAVQADLASEADLKRIVDAAVERFGGVDVLVNNAGIMDSMDGPHETSDAEWERVLRVNLTAPFLLTRAVLPIMLAKGKGAIVNTASEAGLRGSAAGTAYTVSKHGVVGLTRSTAIQVRGKGVRANAIAPGGTATNIQVNVNPEHSGPAAIGAYMGNVGRIAEARELAAAIVFLVPDAASNINGAILPVDNGWSAV